ncbi:MAG: GlxA family transcriptional regulator [Proteobacteria bacterium]|nr:GlxA family transcriptional regulator [Pseudomonadota bacterium]
MRNQAKNVEIGLILYPNVLLMSVYGLTDLFQIANRLAASHDPKFATIRVSHWQLSQKKGAERVFDSRPQLGRSSPSIVVVPPSLSDPMTPEAAVKLARWISAQHDAGATICSVCSGAFLLAETGILAGRVATTHWTYANEFAKRFPQIQVDADRLIIDDGDIMTAGGLMAWTDLGLRIVERLLGLAIMLETARFMVLDPPGREQSYYSSFIPVLSHGDTPILKVQHWLKTQFANETSIPTMAAKAGLEERTFLRRFRKATGLKPTEYCQHLRIDGAREKLESTNQNIDEIAWKVGYEDAGAFRKVFRKIMGLTPGDYRSRFTSN